MLPLTPEQIKAKRRYHGFMRGVSKFCAWTCLAYIVLGVYIPYIELIMVGILFLPINLLGVYMNGKMLQALDQYEHDTADKERQRRIDDLYGR